MKNFKLVELNHETVIDKLEYVYKDLPSSAKIDFSFGFVLQSWKYAELFRYYYAADKNPMFLIPWFSPMTQISILSNRNWEVKIFYPI